MKVDDVLKEELAFAELRAKYPGAHVFHIPDPQGGHGIVYQVQISAKPPGSGE